MKLRLLINFILWIFLISFIGCATRQEIVQFKTDSTNLQQQVTALRQENKELRKMLLELSKSMNQLVEQNRMARADLLAELENLKSQSRVIDSKLADNVDRLSGFIQAMENVQPRPMAVDSMLTDSAEGNGTTAQPVETGADPKSIYNTAYMDLSRGNYELALQGFTEYLRRYPDSEFADNAQYWIGEIYYARAEYQRAIENFKKVLLDFPKGDKRAAALLKIGYCYFQLNAPKAGEQYLKMVIDKFPAAEEARLAKNFLAGKKTK